MAIRLDYEAQLNTEWVEMAILGALNSMKNSLEVGKHLPFKEWKCEKQLKQSQTLSKVIVNIV